MVVDTRPGFYRKFGTLPIVPEECANAVFSLNENPLVEKARRAKIFKVQDLKGLL
jgi:hypothetical protein